MATGTAALVVVGGVWLVFGQGSSNPPQASSGSNASLVAGTAPPTTTTDAPTTTTAVTTTVALTTTPATRARTQPKAAPPAQAMPAPVKPPASIPVPPAVHGTPPPGCTATHTGNRATNAAVQSALTSAAGQNYWAGVSNPPLVNQNPPPADGVPDTSPNLGPPAVFAVPTTLMEAIAWQESGWDSDIQSCDGGVGTMQIQKATADWMNQRFGTSYDYTTLSGNTSLGGEYIEWLISYFGENSFDHHYDMTDQDLVVAVIDAYNVGPGNVQFANGHTVVSHYAQTVEALMTQQPWG